MREFLLDNPNWIVPTPPVGDSSHRVADTEFVTRAVNSAAITSFVSSISTTYFVVASASTGAVTLSGALTATSASLGSDVALNNTTTYFDGPSVAQGTTGTWFASGTVTCADTGVTAALNAKLWDGVTVIASVRTGLFNTGANISMSLSGFISSPAGNIRISVNDPSATTGSIKFNASGNSKDSTITAVRVA